MAGFSYDQIRNHPSRDGFDLSQKKLFTAKVGELLPVYWTHVIPGTKFRIKTQWFTRTMPVETSAFTRIREYYDWFFVPYRLLWKYAPEVVTQMQQNVQSAASLTSAVSVSSRFPTTTLGYLDRFCNVSSGYSNQFGFKRSDLAAKLFQIFGIGSFINSTSPNNYGTSVSSTAFNQKYQANLTVNLFPFLAYQKFWSDWFRYSQWESAQANTFNVDYSLGESIYIPADGSTGFYDNPTFFDLRYANWNKDFFMGALPRAQYGDVAALSMDVVDPNNSKSFFGTVYLNSGNISRPAYTQSDVAVAGSSTAANETGIYPRSNVGTGSGTVPKDTPLSALINNLRVDITALQLRQIKFLQKWKEIAISGDQNYRDQVYKHFGVKVPAALSSMSTFIGGDAGNLMINEVVNQSFGGDDPNATIKGKGIGSGSGFQNFEANEHGILMCIYHAVPLLDYVRTGIDPGFLPSYSTDLPIPEFDKLGFENLPAVVLTNNSYLLEGSELSPTWVSQNLGYVPRYYWMKSKLDEVCGAFTTSLKNWVAPIGPDYLKQWITSRPDIGQESISSYFNANFFRINPKILDSIFLNAADSTWDSDQLLCNFYADVKVVQNLSADSLPY
jgi:hypothetical protein